MDYKTRQQAREARKAKDVPQHWRIAKIIGGWMLARK